MRIHVNANNNVQRDIDMSSPGQFLKEKLNQIQKKNPQFSLRSLASKAGIGPGALSELINGRRQLSDFYAEKLAQSLNLNPEEKRILFSFVGTRSRKFSKQKVLAENELQLITGWEHYAILNLMKTEDFQSSTEWIAARLGLTEGRVQQCLEILSSLHMIYRHGEEWIRNHNSLTTTREIPSRALVEAHKRDLLKAIEVLESTTPNVRSFTSVTMPVNVEKIAEAKELIREFRRKLCHLLEQGSKSEVYNLNIQLFPMTKLEAE